MIEADIRKSIALLGAKQRAVLAELVCGAQMIERFGSWEAYKEVRGRTQPSGVSLSHTEMQQLMRAVPGLATRVADPDKCFVHLPFTFRGAVADALTVTMATDHLFVQQADLEYEASLRQRGG